MTLTRHKKYKFACHTQKYIFAKFVMWMAVNKKKKKILTFN